jgi:hypothetical protein
MDDQTKADMQMDHLDAMADAWAEDCNLAGMIENITATFDLSRTAPREAVQEFRSRMKEQINAMILLGFVEGAHRGICMIQGDQKVYTN